MLTFMFQSTRPVWGATSGGNKQDNLHLVSIHAPRVGRDQGIAPSGSIRRSFNPRAPCGARRQLESRLPPFATYLWAFPSTNTIFSAPETHAPPAA